MHWWRHVARTHTSISVEAKTAARLTRFQLWRPVARPHSFNLVEAASVIILQDLIPGAMWPDPKPVTL